MISSFWSLVCEFKNVPEDFQKMDFLVQRFLSQLFELCFDLSLSAAEDDVSKTF